MSHSIVPAYYLENLQSIYINLTISIITLTLNELNTTIKRQKLTKDRSDKKARPNYLQPTRNTLNIKIQTG